MSDGMLTEAVKSIFLSIEHDRTDIVKTLLEEVRATLLRGARSGEIAFRNSTLDQLLTMYWDKVLHFPFQMRMPRRASWSSSMAVTS